MQAIFLEQCCYLRVSSTFRYSSGHFTKLDVVFEAIGHPRSCGISLSILFWKWSPSSNITSNHVRNSSSSRPRRLSISTISIGGLQPVNRALQTFKQELKPRNTIFCHRPHGHLGRSTCAVFPSLPSSEHCRKRVTRYYSQWRPSTLTNRLRRNAV